MTERFGAAAVRAIRVGTANIQRIYSGSQIIWSGTNPIPTENARTGVTAASAGATTVGRGQDGFYGFARQFSRNIGQTIDFSVDGVNAANIAIHRIGHYGGLNWRLVATVTNTGTNQPDSVAPTDGAGARGCAGWSTTASWAIPADEVSGFYVGVVRNSSNVPQSWIPFIVRDDARVADIVLRVSDSTWGGAYNFFGTKAAPLGGKSVYGEGAGGSVFNINLRGTRMSYDRPLVTRSSNSNDNAPFVNHWDILESALIDWIEKNGYNVKYISCYDLDQGLGAVGAARILACAGHDEYWSDGMVNNTEAFIANGGHHVSMSANSLFWRIRWADGGRSFYCYKDTMQGPTVLRSAGAGTPLDPVSWTGTWRDTRWSQRRPENLLLGATFRMNGIRDETMVINGAANQTKPFWRNTTVAAGSNLTVAQVIGFEADSLDFPNSGGVDLGTTTINISGAYADDNGENYGGNGTLNWGIASHYPRPGLATGMSVHFSTNQWMWGLSNYHRRGGAVINREMRQATYNLLTDLGASAGTKESDLTTVTPVALSAYGAVRVTSVTVTVAPGSVQEDGAPNLVFTFARPGTSGALAVNFTIGGSATNGTDYATITSPVTIADGSTTAIVTVNPATDSTAEQDETVILSIAPGTGYTAGSPGSATGTILNDDAGPLSYQLTPDSTIVAAATVDPSSYEMGMRFQVSENTVATAIKFYRPVTNTNANGLLARTWRTTLWSQNQPMASGTVSTAASQTGWITATLDNPIAFTTGITYTVTVLIPAVTGYSATAAFFTSGVVPGSPNPLTAATNAGGFGSNRLQPVTTFNNTFYHVQPVVSGVTAAKVMWTPSAGYTSFLTHSVEGPYELGSRYTVTADQSITGVRFLYAQDDTTTTTTVRVWNSTGTLLASKAATGIIAGVYNTVLLDTAVVVTAGQTFVVSYTSGTRLSISSDFVTQNRAVPFGTYVRNGLNTTVGSYPDTAGVNKDYYVMPVLA